MWRESQSERDTRLQWSRNISLCKLKVKLDSQMYGHNARNRQTLASERFCRTPGIKDRENLTQADPIAVAIDDMMLTVVMI